MPLRIRVLLVAAMLALPLPAILAQAVRVDAAIHALEQQRTTAMVNADVATLERLLADDLTYAHSSGLVDTKASLLALLKSGELKYTSIVERDVVAREYGSVTILTGQALIAAQRVNAAAITHDLLFTAAWARTGGAWHFVAWHSTEIKQ